MKYIRTECGIYKRTKVVRQLCDNEEVAIILPDKNEFEPIINQADTIEELICNDDILYIYDLYPDAVLVVEGNVKPFGYPKEVKLKEWLNYKHKF